ncbi:YxeA family protein [Paenibacillus cellulositrophicus]|uniref:YxeA family protein n=1 Tax=Paenibacillus cellulositrophicus TaxID=562959 RepID=UPI003D9A0164
MKKGGAVAALIIIILAVFLVMSARDVVDRFNPLVPQEDVFVRIDKPAENDNGRYKYKLTGYNLEGEKKKVIFTSSTQLPEGTYLKVSAKGAYTENYTKVKEEDVPRNITW